MRKTKDLTLLTSAGPTKFIIKELSGPAVLRLAGPLACVINKFKGIFTAPSSEAAPINVASSLIESLSTLSDDELKKLQDGLLKNHLVAHFEDGRVDTFASEHMDQLFPASLALNYLQLLFAALELSFASFFAPMLSQIQNQENA